MLIGRYGNFILKTPFNQYAPEGLKGQIVGVNFIKHLISKGTNVEATVYVPVDFVEAYPNDLAANVIIVTIKAEDGRKYSIPDIYIENLYDDNLNYADAYVTVRIAKLPVNYDFTYIRNQLAKEASKFSGVQVNDKDVFVSLSTYHHVMSHDEAYIYDREREAKIEALPSDYGRYVAVLKENKVIAEKLDSLENKVKDLF